MAADGSANPSPAPKILLAKPGLVTSGKFNRGGADEEAALRSRLSSIASLNLLSDTWDLQIDRLLPVSSLSSSKTHSVRSSIFVGEFSILSDIFGGLVIIVQFLTENAEFTVVGVIGPPGVGKSTILNEIYGSDSSSPGMCL